MNPQTIKALVVLAIIGVLVFAVTNSFRSTQVSTVPTPTGAEIIETSPPSTTTTPAKKEQTAEYIHFSTQLPPADSRRRILFFYANWCPTCRPANEEFTQNISRLPGDVTLIRVNYNDSDTDADEKELAKKYGITYQHTFVQIDDAGNAIARWNGGDINDLLENME